MPAAPSRHLSLVTAIYCWQSHRVRSLYDGMVRIVVTPTWVKLIDFEITLPSAVEELVRQRAERQRA